MRSLLSWATILAIQYVVYVRVLKPQVMHYLGELARVIAALSNFGTLVN